MKQRFVPAARPGPPPGLSRHIFVSDGRLLCAGNTFVHSRLAVTADLLLSSHYLGDLAGQACGVHRVATEVGVPAADWRGLRSLLGQVDEEMFHLAGRAVQVSNWDADHRFCGRCGTATVLSAQGERCRVCPGCQLAVYPRISPCVIMLVTRGRQCLLARHSHHRHGLFTALAGFIEPGETAEQAVAREVQEEVGLAVGQPQYVASQPWPFPGQLMLGYTVPWRDGELVPDRDEITEAHWFDHADLPDEIPPPQTLSGQLIRGFIRAAATE